MDIERQTCSEAMRSINPEVDPDAIFEEAEGIVKAHRPSNPALEGFEPTAKKKSAQSIVQRLAMARNWQQLGKPNKQLELEIREEIEQWGGVEAIDEWLEENDPDHSMASNIRKMDWSFLK